MVFINSREHGTLALGLNFPRRADDSGGFTTDVKWPMAGTVPVMPPSLLAFCLALASFIQGIVFTGVKG